MGGVPSGFAFRARTSNVIYISNPIVNYDIEENFLKFYGMVGEDPIAVFLADYIFICEKIMLGLSILYYSPVTCDCTTYCFTSFNSQIFLALSEALNEFTFRGNYSERTLYSDANEDCHEMMDTQSPITDDHLHSVASEHELTGYQ